jgi:hypothetical protein
MEMASRQFARQHSSRLARLGLRVGHLPGVMAVLFWPYLIVLAFTPALSRSPVAVSALVLWIFLNVFLDEVEEAARQARNDQERQHDKHSDAEDGQLDGLQRVAARTHFFHGAH